MNNTYASTKGYALAAILGAIGGGLLVAVATKAIPKLMSGMIARYDDANEGQRLQSGRNMRENDEGLR